MMSKYEERVELINRDQRDRHKNKIFIDKDADGMIARFRENIENVRSRFRLYNQLVSQKMNDEAEDILRFQIVYLMSALDFYMHELYCYSLLKVFNNQQRKTYRYKEYRVPLKLVEFALYDGENIEKHLKEVFVELNSSFTFMHPNKIRELLNIISYDDEFDVIEERLKNSSILRHQEHLDNVLEEIYHRRNKISHQTDIDHGKEFKNKIHKDEVLRYADIISILVEELHKIICTE